MAGRYDIYWESTSDPYAHHTQAGYMRSSPVLAWAKRLCAKYKRQFGGRARVWDSRKRMWATD